MSETTEREALLKDAYSSVKRMKFFMGNLDFPSDFEQFTPENSSNYAFRNVESKEEQFVMLLGEVAGATHGTRTGAMGNHYRGKPGEFKPIQDGNSIKDILKLRLPAGSSIEGTILFGNQFPAINSIYEANCQDDAHHSNHPLFTTDWVDCTAAPDADRRVVDLLTVTLPKKFGSPSSPAKGPVNRTSSNITRVTKRIGLPGDSSTDVSDTNVPTSQASSATANSSDEAQPKEQSSLIPVLGGFYSPTLLPDYNPEIFQLQSDQLVQNDIRDINNQLIPAWKMAEHLRPGTVVLVCACLNVYNIYTNRANPSQGFKRIYQILARNVRVVAESLEAYDPPTAPITHAPTAPEASRSPEKSTMDDFNNFTSKKRIENRKTAHKVDTRRHSTRASEKGKEKEADVSME